MALSLASTATASEKQIAQVIEAMFGVQPGYTILTDLAAHADANGADATANLLIDFADNTETAASFTAAVLANLGIEADNAGYATASDYVSGGLAGLDKSEWGAFILETAILYSGLTGSEGFTGAAALAASAADYNTRVIASLNYSLVEENTEINSGEAPDTNIFYLTSAADHIVGTAGDDTFIARGNSSLNNADIIDGGAGVDTIEVMLDNGETAESPLVTNVEILKVQAQDTTWDSGDNDVDNEFGGNVNDDDIEANIDAGDMRSVEQYWSEDSRADVTIEDVSRNSHITTVGMRETDPGDVDLNVFFDPENITSPGEGTGESSLVIRLVNVFNLAEGESVFEGFDGFTFNVGDTTVTVSLEDINANFVAGDDQYAQLVAAIQDAIDAEGLTGVTVTEMPERDAVFSIDVDGYSTGDIAGTYTPIQIVSDSEQLTAGSFSYSDIATTGNVVNTMSDVPADIIPSLTQVDVILDRVGKNSEGGDLLIGSDSTGDSGSAGIQQFNIDVDRDSWLTSVSSTNNTLEVINVENISDNNADGDGSLTINSITDVRVFDASAMAGDVTLGADLTGNVVPKYFDLEDTDEDPTADNSELNYLDVVDNEFSYDFGSGDDSLDLWIDDANLANAFFVNNVGTTTREDFVLSIETNDGDDTVDFMIGDGDGIDGDHWYENSKLNANLSIDTGAGDDTIWTYGAGDVVINAGSGNDTVYTDNSGDYPITGRKAVFVYNVASSDPSDRSLVNLLSDANDTGYRLYDGTLTLTFKGFESTVSVPNTNGFVSDLEINQAIKDAINNNDVLNKLLVAKDGPANTLVVESLIDGDIDTSELSFMLEAPDADSLSTGEVTNLSSWYGLPGSTAASLVAAMNTDINAFEAKGDYDTQYGTFFGGPDYVGVDSTVASDNIVTPDLGDDVIVLGTSAWDNDTVVYEGFENGYDTIVNFDTDLNPQQVVINSVNQAETVTISFSDLDGADPASIDFDTVNIDLAFTGDAQGLIPAEDVAYQFAQGAFPNWTAVWDQGTDTVVLTSTNVGDQTDLTAADFTINGATGTVSVDNIIQGTEAFVAGTYEVFTVDFGGTIVTADGSFDFDGTTINYTIGDGEVTLADSVASASYANWTAVDNFDGTVTFTATAYGDVTDTDYTDMFAAAGATTINGTDGIVSDAANVTQGVDAIGTQTVQIVNGADSLDYLDFTDYDASEVVVDGSSIVGAAADGELYVSLTESATNDGEYLIELYEEAGADDVLIGTIGIADFGVEQAFIPENFII